MDFLLRKRYNGHTIQRHTTSYSCGRLDSETVFHQCTASDTVSLELILIQ